MRRLLFVISMIVLMMPSVASAKSWAPDNDNSNINNNFSTAPLIDVLRTDASGKPTGYFWSGELGVVLGGFDTRDMIKAKIARFQRWNLHFALREQPETSMWLVIYNERGEFVDQSRGGANEDWHYEFREGTYFISIQTD